jgi:hypothetical protein
VIDRDGDETGVGQRLGRVVVTQEVTAPAMRDDDERQLPASQRTISVTVKTYAPIFISPGGLAHGYQIAPFSGESAPLAGTSMR